MSGGLPEGFLVDIVADIDDDTPRLVYADWLEERGQEERAEFIRLQIERTRLPSWDAAQVRLRLRERELLDRHGESWLSELPTIEGARWEGFRRGIVAEVSFTDFESMRANAHACRAIAPVEAVTVRWPRRRESRRAVPPIAELRELSLTGRAETEDEIAFLADSPQLSTLRILTARGLWAEGLESLVASPHLARLKALRLPSNGLGNAGIQALIGAASLSALEEIDLSGRGVSERYNNDPIVRLPGMESLAGWSGLATVRSLILSNNDLGRAGLRTLLRSPHSCSLKELSVRGGRLEASGMAEFASAPSGLLLDTLDIGENLIGPDGVEHIATAACLRELKTLRIDRCEISLLSAKVFVQKASFLGGLRSLDVSHNHFGPIGLNALLKQNPPLLHTLIMRDNDLRYNGAEILASSAASDVLLEVDLSHNGLGEASVRVLGETSHLRNLLALRLWDNPLLNKSSTATMKASPLARRLMTLEMDDPNIPSGDDIPF